MRASLSRAVLALTVAVSIGQTLPASACIGCQMGKRIGVAAEPNLRPVPARSTGFTASWRAPAPPRPAVPRVARVEASPTRLPRLGGSLPPHSVLMCESKGDIRAENPVSSASGKWQITDGSWGGHGGYSHASHAPESVQDERARQMWANGSGKSHWRQCL